MNDGPVFSIGEQHAGRDIYNIARDLNINQNSPATDVLKIFEAIQSKVSELDIGEKDKKKIVFHACYTNGLIIRGVDPQEYKDINNIL